MQPIILYTRSTLALPADARATAEALASAMLAATGGRLVLVSIVNRA